jgi:hypothetical protein
MNNGITAEIKKINKVLEQKLSIPDYQRPYRWKEENVRLLLQDVFDSWKGGKKSYRIGSVILHKEERVRDEIRTETGLNIVDGQQRITSILLVLNVLQSKIGESLRKSLQYDHIDSKNNIVQNNLFIERWIKENINNNKEDFCKYLSEYCELVEIVVTDLSEAFQMFDSQNGRGKELESYNLLKAFHIRAMDSESQDTKIDCDKRWESATRFKKNKNDENENPTDILKQVFNEQLYRTRVWSRKEEAYGFNKQKLHEFKGVTIDKNNSINYPFQNVELLQFIANKYFESFGLGVKGIKNRFAEANFENINPFVQINQNILNGKTFFDYVETYVEIYKQLFRYWNKSTQLIEFKEFYKAYCCDYTGSGRTGDRYLKELYKSLIFLMFDKYGEEGVVKYYKTLYALVYRVRLEYSQVRYATVVKYPLDGKLFSTIENSQSYLDLQKLEKKSKEDFNYKKEAPVIEKFFNDFGVIIKINK